MSEKLRKTVRIIASVVLAVSLCMLVFYLYDSIHSRQVDEKVSGLKDEADTVNIPSVLAEYAPLVAENPDAIGWLKLDGTNIDYVVMYAPEEKDKYLHTDFYGDYSYRGCLYISEKCDIFRSDNLIINGHNMKDGSMFGTLPYYMNEDFWQQHKTFSFDTIYEKQTYEVVAAIKTAIPPEGEKVFRYYQYVESGDKEKFAQYKSFIEENKLYDTGVELQDGDKLLTLTTCAYHTTDGRFIVVARKLV